MSALPVAQARLVPGLAAALPMLRLRYLWVALVLVGTFIGPASTPLGILDIWWTVKSGEWMVAHQAFLSADPFTSAPAVVPQFDGQWLSQLIYYAFYHFGGIELLTAGNAAAASLAYVFVFAASYVASKRLRLSCCAVVAAYLLGLRNLSARPQTLAYPIFGLFLLALMRAEWRRDFRLFWVLPAAAAVWANVHGSFFLGLLLLSCGGAGTLARTRSLRAIRPYALTLAACALAVCITPYGPGSLVYIASIGSNPIIRDLVTEWAPTSTGWREGGFFFASIAVLGAIALRSRVRLRPTEWLILLAFGYLAISSVRSVIWWGFVVAPIGIRLASGLLPRPGERDQTPEKPALNAAILAIIAVLFLVSLPWLKAVNPFLPTDKRALIGDDAPQRVSQFLQTHTYSGRMLNQQSWGSYLDWAVWPTHQPFTDGRIELHPDQVWLDYLTIRYPGAQWRALLDKYDIGYMVLSQDLDSELIAAVQRDGTWTTTYSDDQSIVLARTSSLDSASNPSS